MGRRRGLQPHRLPDAGGGRVEDASARMGLDVVQPLLADRLAAGLGGVPDGDDDRVGAAPVQQIGDVVREGVVAAVVGRPGLPVVDPHGGAPVARAEVELDAPAVPAGRHHEGALVPELVVRGDAALDAGERRLGDERHPDLLRERGGPAGVRRGHGEVPDAVQIRPVGAGELRARILGQRVVDRDLAGPRGGHRGGFRRPRRRRRGRGAGNGEGGGGQQGRHRQDGRRPPASVAGGRDGCECSTHRHSSGSGGGRRARARSGRLREERDRPPYRTRRREPGRPAAASGVYRSCRRRPSHVWATTTTARKAPLTTCW